MTFFREGRWWIGPDGIRLPVIAGGTNAFAVTQAAFRFYADGTESGSVAAGNENTNISSADLVAGNYNVLLRVRLDETGGGSISGATTDDYQLQYSKNAGAYANVNGASTNVKGFNSANLTDAGATTQRLTAGAGSFVAGKISEDGLVDNWQLTANNHGELLYAITVIAADVANADTLDFRVLLNGAVMTYSVTPRITVVETAGTGARNFPLDTGIPSDVLSTTTLPSSTTGDFTRLIWVYAETSPTGTVFSFDRESDSGTSQIHVTVGGTGKWAVFVAGGLNSESATTVATGSWYPVALRKSSGTVNLIVNGVETNISATPTYTAPTLRLTIGARRDATDWSNGSQWKGRLSHYAEWTRAVSTTDLLDMVTNSKSPKHYATNLVEYWKIPGSASPEPSALSTGNSLTVVGTTQIQGPTLSDPAGAAMAAAVSGAATVTAALTTAIQFAASLAGAATVTAVLTTAIALAAGVSGTATVTGSMATPGANLAAAVSGSATTTAALTTAIQCAASVTGAATTTAALTTAIRFAAAVTGTATVVATMVPTPPPVTYSTKRPRIYINSVERTTVVVAS